jgi:hypothetical protein
VEFLVCNFSKFKPTRSHRALREIPHPDPGIAEVEDARERLIKIGE